jgi:hypothetical protein
MTPPSIDTNVPQRSFPPGTVVKCRSADSSCVITGVILKNKNVKILRVNLLTHTSPNFTYQPTSNIKEFFIFVQKRIDAERIDVTLPNRCAFTMTVQPHLSNTQSVSEDVMNTSYASSDCDDDPTNF